MNEIISKLQNLGTEDNEESSTPRTKQNHLCSKMSKVIL